MSVHGCHIFWFCTTSINNLIVYDSIKACWERRGGEVRFAKREVSNADERKMKHLTFLTKQIDVAVVEEHVPWPTMSNSM